MTSFRNRWRTLIGGVLLALLVTSPAAIAGPVPIAQNGKIAFSRNVTVSGNGSKAHRILTMTPLGTQLTTVSNGGGVITNDDTFASYSWNGSRIVLSREISTSERQLVTMNSDGSGSKTITQGVSRKTTPVFTADGSRIIYASDNDGDYEIYSRKADGSGLIQLTKNTADDMSPSVDANGRIFFTRDNEDIFRMNSDGSGIVQLTNSPGWNSTPDVSRSGAVVVFSSDRDGGETEIYSMKSDGSSETRLTNDPDSDVCPEISPDGKQIAFCTNRFDTGGDVWNYDIATMSIGGAGVKQITKLPTIDVEPSWQPVVTLPNPVPPPPM
ncbi:MAG TPA: hypothetical protein VMF31_07765 [Solirubrobacterales bacterium]|nr:hypothetical protein [Solirubrobacterales bacterium]